MAKSRLVVVGGDAAGMSAASQVHRMQPDMEIIVYERGAHVSYSACGIPYYIGGIVDPVERLVIRTAEKFRSSGINVHSEHEVTEIDVNRGRVKILSRSDRAENWAPFDQLLIATGASGLRPSIEGINAQGIYEVSTIPAAINVRKHIEQQTVDHVVVVGAGYIGIEMAEAILAQGKRVSVVEMAGQVMSTLDPDIAELVSEQMRVDGVELYLGETVQGFEVSEGRVKAVVTNQRRLETQLVILGLGVRPNSKLAEAAGIGLGARGAIGVDHHMRTRSEGIWAAGDCAETFNLVSQKSFYCVLATVANKCGRIAGINIAGGDAAFPGIVGTAITKFGNLEIGRTGLQEKEARMAGLEYVTATIKATTRATYFPEPGHITVKLIAEKGRGRLLGGQIVGGEGTAKRIDVIATALHGRFTLEEMVNLDLGYAPPLAPAWDPILTAARQLVKLV